MSALHHDRSKYFLKNLFDNKPLEELKKVIVPDWHSTESQVRMLKIPKVDYVLEIGCGVGRLLKHLAETRDGCFYGIDASECMVECAKEYLNDTGVIVNGCVGDGAIPFDLDFFDCVFSFTVFQHIPSTATVKRYIRDAHAVLREGGELIFNVLAENYYPDRDSWAFHHMHDLFDEIDMFSDGYVEVVDSWWVYRLIK